MAEDDLKELEDMFDASDDDDLADFMNMLDNIDADASELEKEMAKADSTELEQELLDAAESGDGLNPFGSDLFQLSDEDEKGVSSSISDMMAGLGLEDDELQDDTASAEQLDFNLEDDTPLNIPEDVDGTSFVTPQEEDLLDFMEDDGPLELGEDFAVGESEEDDDGLADILGGMEDEDESEEDQEISYVEKKGLIRRIVEKFRKTPTEEELLARQQEEEEERAWEEQQQEKAEAKKAEAAEQKKAKKEEAEKKKQEKSEKAEAKKAAAAEQKAAKQAAKEAKRGPVPKSQLVPVKPIIAFVVIGIACSVVFIFFTNHRFYSSSVSKAKEYFIHQKYKEAFEELLGLEIKQKDEKFYEQVKTVRIVDKDLEAYDNYIELNDYEMALESLVKGVGKYEVQLDKAKELSLEKEMHNLYEEMVSELANRYQMTAQDALNLYQSKDKEYYENQITQLARDAALRDGVLEPVEVSEAE